MVLVFAWKQITSRATICCKQLAAATTQQKCISNRRDFPRHSQLASSATFVGAKETPRSSSSINSVVARRSKVFDDPSRIPIAWSAPMLFTSTTLGGF
ncbi:hypothetical protein TNCV_4465241 [Trichonephila clavipes]|nr:hypothetical protein TNCV_4465241 [Trichonephila clavipes]